MNRRLLLALSLLLALGLQNSLPAGGRLGLRPDWLAYFSAWAGLFLPLPQATALGALAGLLEDLLNGRHIGLNLLCQGLTAFALAGLAGRLLWPGPAVAVALAALASICRQGLYGLLGLLWGQSGLPPLLGPNALLTVLLALPLYLLLRWLSAGSGISPRP